MQSTWRFFSYPLLFIMGTSSLSLNSCLFSNNFFNAVSFFLYRKDDDLLNLLSNVGFSRKYLNQKISKIFFSLPCHRINTRHFKVQDSSAACTRLQMLERIQNSSIWFLLVFVYWNQLQFQFSKNKQKFRSLRYDNSVYQSEYMYILKLLLYVHST